MRAAVRELRKAGKTIGLVPTMGALHAGHISLVQRAKRDCDVAVTTIFVNPTQFAPHEDLQKYPRTLENDLDLLAGAECELAFVPSAQEIYPPGATTFVEPPAVASPLEGVCRPGHFRGVATIVLKLFNIIPADVAYFGQKDFQQALVIRRMSSDLNIPTRIEICPIVREPDGLALSSRNVYLSPEQRAEAPILSRSLREVAAAIASGAIKAPSDARQEFLNRFAAASLARLDYFEIVDSATLEALQSFTGKVPRLIAAAFFGKTRLIDNVGLPQD